MRNPRAAVLTLASVVALSTGCAASGASDPGDARQAESVVYLPEAKGGALLLFNSFTQHLVSYDPSTFSVVSETNAPNYSQYAFPTGGEYFTSGSSDGKDFRIVRVHDNEIDTLLKLPDGEGVFPFATDENRLLFLHTTYDDASRETSRALVELRGDRLVAVPGVTGAVDRGVVVADELFYTSYVADSDDYQLRSVSLTGPAGESTLLQSGLREPGLYAHEGRVFTSTADSLVNGDTSYSCVDLCWFRDELGVLLSMHLNDDAGLSLDVIDTTSGAVVDTRSDVVDFAVDGSTVVVYRTGSIDRIALDEVSR